MDSHKEENATENNANMDVTLSGDTYLRKEPDPIVQEILKDSITSTGFDAPNLSRSECYVGNDRSATDSSMSLPASTILLTAKPFKSRIPVRQGATTPSDYDRLSAYSGRSTPTGYDSMCTSFNNELVHTNEATPNVALRPGCTKRQLSTNLNKMSLKREASLPPYPLYNDARKVFTQTQNQHA